MPQSLSRVVVHIVFATKYRHPFLVDEKIRSEMHAYIGGTCNEMQCPVLTVGGVADHVHILCALSRNVPIAKLVCDIKRGSSKWVKTKGGLLTKFAWQNGYAVFSVGEDGVERLRSYIRGQEEHHRKKIFQEEYRSFLNEFGVEYDERYVWD
jgi:REP element-mobilizing transposase RayT